MFAVTIAENQSSMEELNFLSCVKEKVVNIDQRIY